jgi:hypothetical protein
MALSDYQLRNSTEYGGSQGETTVTYKYRPPESTWYSFIPAYNATKTDPEIGTVYFASWSKRNEEEDDDFVFLDLVYTDNPARSGFINKEDNDDVYLPKPSTFEKPLESATGYLTKWNHELYVISTSATGGTPVWWAGATDKSDADGSTYMWSSDNPGDNWVKLEDKTKPGIESWLAPAFAVEYQFWNATKSSVEAILKTVGTQVTPGETFGYTGDWLVTGVSIDEDGTRYKGVVEYTHADDWDTDLYPVGS